MIILNKLLQKRKIGIVEQVMHNYGLSEKSLGDLLGISQSTVSLLKLNKKQMNSDLKRKFYELFEVEI